MRTPEAWFVTTDVPTEFNPVICNNQWTNTMLKSIKQIHLQVTSNLNQNQQNMHKHFGPFRVIKWYVGTKVMVHCYKQQEHCLSPLLEGSFPIVVKISPTVYGVKVPQDKVVVKWYHSSQLKVWKGP